MIMPIKIPTTRITVKCLICKHVHIFDVPSSDFKKWRNGIMIQFAFPYLSAEDRDIIISQICPKCMPKDEENDDATT